MAKIVVVGGTGYAGSAVVREATRRGHEVTSISRTVPEPPINEVNYLTGDVLTTRLLDTALADADAIVSTLSPRGELDGKIVDVDQHIAQLARQHSARLFVLGGFSSLRPAPGEPNSVDAGLVPEQFLPEATQMHTVLTSLTHEPEGLDWVFISPAQEFGSYVPGEDLGHYRIGGDVALFDDNGRSAISGPDLARAIVDRIENNDYHREHISIAY